jgi:DegV family protein with EDD domain
MGRWLQETGGRTVKKVAVVTDSSATVPPDLVQELDIRVVPIWLALDGHAFRDGVDITAAEVYRWLRKSKRLPSSAIRSLPTTSAPSVGDFLRVYAAAAQEASGIVSIHLSPSLSATYNSAFTASQLVDGPDGRPFRSIRVVNCHTAAMGQGFVVLAAARAAAAGADLEAVAARAQKVAARVNLLATIGTLEYLHRGGRIGGAATLLGTMLQIKPVLYVADGHVDVFARPRTLTKALRVMLQEMAERVNGDGRGARPLHVAILHADEPEKAEVLRQQVVEQFDCAELYVTELTPVMGAHTGPGVLGVAFYSEEALSSTPEQL